MRLRFIGLLALLAVAGFLAVWGIGLGIERLTRPSHAWLAGSLAEFELHPAPRPLPLSSFQNADGDTVSFADLRGQFLLINLWATWCAPCIEELPQLDALQAALGSDRFQVVTISLDRGASDRVAEFLDGLELANLPRYQDPSTKLGAEIGAPGLPITVLADPEGREIGRLLGPAEWDGPEAMAMIRHYLENEPEVPVIDDATGS